MVVISLVIIGCYSIPQEINDRAVSIVRDYLEALRTNDYSRIISLTWIWKQDEPINTETNINDLGVLSLTIKIIEVSKKETKRIQKMYSNSDLANRYGWSNNFIKNNMIAVFAQYEIEYDNTKVPNDGGEILQYFYLIKEKEGSSCLIWTQSYDVNE